jgi:hypothetical protein
MRMIAAWEIIKITRQNQMAVYFQKNLMNQNDFWV